MWYCPSLTVIVSIAILLLSLASLAIYFILPRRGRDGEDGKSCSWRPTTISTTVREGTYTVITNNEIVLEEPFNGMMFSFSSSIDRTITVKGYRILSSDNNTDGSLDIQKNTTYMAVLLTPSGVHVIGTMGN